LWLLWIVQIILGAACQFKQFKSISGIHLPASAFLEPITSLVYGWQLNSISYLREHTLGMQGSLMQCWSQDLTQLNIVEPVLVSGHARADLGGVKLSTPLQK